MTGEQVEVSVYANADCTGTSVGALYSPIGICNTLLSYQASCNGTNVIAEPCNGATWPKVDLFPSVCTGNSLETLFGIPGAKITCVSDASTLSYALALVVAVAGAIAMLM